MNTSRKVNITARGVNKNSKVLRSDEDFERWYLEQFDFSMFTEMEVKDAMEEERPEYYPCIPLLLEDGYEVIYLEEDLIDQWVMNFYSINLPPL